MGSCVTKSSDKYRLQNNHSTMLLNI